VGQSIDIARVSIIFCAAATAATDYKVNMQSVFKCSNCGAELLPGADHCEYCGTVVPANVKTTLKPAVNENTKTPMSVSRPKSGLRIMTQSELDLLVKQRREQEPEKSYLTVSIITALVSGIIITGLFSFGVGRWSDFPRFMLLLLLCVTGPTANLYIVTMVFKKLNDDAMIPLLKVLFVIQAIGYFMRGALVYFPKK